jgi:hypothetical protein
MAFEDRNMQRFVTKQSYLFIAGTLLLQMT